MTEQNRVTFLFAKSFGLHNFPFQITVAEVKAICNNLQLTECD